MEWVLRIVIVIVIVIHTTVFMVLSSWHGHRLCSPGSSDEQKTVPNGCRLHTKPLKLSHKSGRIDSCRVHVHRQHFITTQPEN